MPIKVETEGFDELVRTMRTLENTPTREQEVDACVDGAKLILDAMKRLVPVRSGRLRDSLTIKVEPAGQNGRFGIGRKGAVVAVGPKMPDGWYGRLVEFGTVNMPAHPFVRPAYDQNKNRALDEIRKSIWIDIRSAATRR